MACFGVPLASPSLAYEVIPQRTQSPAFALKASASVGLLRLFFSGRTSCPSPRQPRSAALHRLLRAATRGDHAAVDELVTAIDFNKHEGYGLFLNLHYVALQSLQSQWDPADVLDFGAMCRCLIDDLEALGVAKSTPASATVALTDAQRLGAAYVIRGSRLGAVFLRRRVPHPFPTRYLDFVPHTSWSAFLRRLSDFSQDADSNANAEVLVGARVAFEVFDNLLLNALSRP
jgi:heme oxygenase (biliverdin-IX-beta and delta-forming)